MSRSSTQKANYVKELTQVEGEMCGVQEEEQHLGKASIQKMATYCPKGTPYFSLGPSAQLQA